VEKSPRIATAITRWLIAVVMLVLLLLPAAMQMMATRDNVLRGELKPTATSKPQFKVRGSVGGLYPGKRKPLTLKVRNPQRYPIRVKTLTVRVGRSNKSGCKPRWIRPKRRVRVSLLVPARARAFVSYPLKMLKRAPNACQGARWKLKFKGEAVRAR
jgi:hypothetical protein